MQQRKYGDAIAIFTDGLTIVKEALALSPPPQEESCSCAFSRIQDYQFVEIETPTFLYEDLSASKSSYIFCSPVSITEASPNISALKVSVILIFNLALSHHLFAVERQCPGEFLKAQRLYELVHQIQKQEDLELCVLHNMALANNLGHVHQSLNNAQKSRMCFEHLLATLMYFVEGGDGDKVEHLQGFFRNAAPLILGDISLAPAA